MLRCNFNLQNLHWNHLQFVPHPLCPMEDHWLQVWINSNTRNLTQIQVNFRPIFHSFWNIWFCQTLFWYIVLMIILSKRMHDQKLLWKLWNCFWKLIWRSPYYAISSIPLYFLLLSYLYVIKLIEKRDTHPDPSHHKCTKNTSLRRSYKHKHEGKRALVCSRKQKRKGLKKEEELKNWEQWVQSILIRNSKKTCPQLRRLGEKTNENIITFDEKDEEDNRGRGVFNHIMKNRNVRTHEGVLMNTGNRLVNNIEDAVKLGL